MKGFGLAVLVFLMACSQAAEKTVVVPKEEKKADAAILLTEAIECYKNKEYSKARQSFQQALTGNKNIRQQITIYKYLAFMDAIDKNMVSAKKHFIQALTLDKNFELNKSEYGNPLWTPVYEEARKEFLQMQYSGEEWFKEGQQLYLERKYTEALTAFDSALNKKDLSKENQMLAYKYQAFIYALQKQPEKAKTAFRKAFTLSKKFQLDKSEYGNPVWTPLYEEIKKEFQK